MAKTEMFFIVGGIAAGVAIAGSLFLLYPDMMFKNTSFQAQQSGELPDLGGATTTTTTTTANAGTNGTNSSAGNTTSGVQGSTSTPPPTGSPY